MNSSPIQIATLNNDDIIFYSSDRVVKLDFYNLYKFPFTAVAWSDYCSTTFAAIRVYVAELGMWTNIRRNKIKRKSNK